MESSKTAVRLGGIAACALAMVAGREYYAQSIAPLRLRESETSRGAEELRERIADARKTIAEIRAQEKDAERVRGELARLREEMPAGAATVVLPALAKGHFDRNGIAVPVVRLNTTQDEPEQPGYEHGYWSAALPVDGAGRNIIGMLVAVADIEEEYPFLRVLDFAIRPEPENPQGRVGLLNLGTLIRK